MLKRFSVEGYRGFKGKVSFDLSSPRDYRFNASALQSSVIKDALVYGRNGVGKTNLCKALLDARRNVALDAMGQQAESTFLNADISRDAASFSYLLDLGGHDVLYEYTKNARGILRTERLEVDGETVYDVGESGEWRTNNLGKFTSGSLVVEGRDLYLGLSALSYVCTNTPQKLLGPILDLYRFLLSMRLNNTAATLGQDVRDILEADKVGELQSFLHEYGIAETLEARPDASGTKILYMRKHARPIPFADVCSSGTRALVRLFVINRLREARPSLLVLDEFDAFYHHDLAEHVLRSMLDNPDMQVIATTHNTDLFSNRSLRPDCLFVLSEGGIVAAADATTRELREGHNLERLYKAGEFDV